MANTKQARRQPGEETGRSTSCTKEKTQRTQPESVSLPAGTWTENAPTMANQSTNWTDPLCNNTSEIKKAKSSNPLFILDEIDKLGVSNHGDPSSALLEVLDPEQNHSFYDNYIETEYDLSKVMFIATANNLSNIQAPLKARMEIIEVNGYTLEEKIEIAKKHLLPKQIKEHGLKKTHIKISVDALSKIIEEYTNESGVRSLD